MVDNLPLLELFTRLHEAGLPLGIDEYQLLPKALQKGFGVSDHAALARLCRALWVNSAEEKLIFDYHFNQVIAVAGSSTPRKAVISDAKKLPKHQIDTEKQFKTLPIRYITGGGILVLCLGVLLRSCSPKNYVDQLTAGDSEPNPTPIEEQPIQEEPIISPNPTPNSNPDLSGLWILLLILALGTGTFLVRWIAKLIAKRRDRNILSTFAKSQSEAITPLPPEFTGEGVDEVQVAQASRQAAVREQAMPDQRFLRTAEYFPITRRQMKQSWRYLRRPVREGPPIELDVEATVDQIGRHGLLLKPVLVPRRVNRAELLLLIDQDGSMVPFHGLSQRLSETASQSGRLGKAGVYYFHNSPTEYLYHDAQFQSSELVDIILTQQLSQRAVALIFSDAGAARGSFNQYRIGLIRGFLGQLKRHVRYIVWLNPLPPSRWLNTTAGEIARLVPMFEVSRCGFQDSIDVLRGYVSNEEGRVISVV
ncbi:MAG: hypothetical protein F6K19_32800 [Cyanothece sp. SIO1E1]|nr:hypothetical protein [Cyanothece sp. SIO1E1]